MDAPAAGSTVADDRRALIRALLAKRGVAAVVQPVIGRRAPDTPPLLSLPQQRLWFLEQLQPGGSSYNLSAALSLSGQLDVAALERALATIVARHDALRTCFATRDGEGAADIANNLTVSLPLDDLSSMSAATREAALDALLASQAHAPFDLGTAPLFRVRLVRLEARQHVLALTAHHIIFDGWSIALFIKELGALYVAALRGTAAPVEPLPIGYADFAAWQRRRVETTALDHDLGYWTTQLAALSPLDLPTDRPRPAVSAQRGSSRTFSLPPELTGSLTTLARAHDATLFMALVAGLFAVLGRYTGQTDVAIGSPTAGRSQPELEGVIGLFANMLVLRGDLTGSPTFVELLARVRRMTLDAYAHQEAPFEALVERLQPERRFAQQPLFRVAFAMQHEGIGELRLPGLDVRARHVPSNASKFDLTIALTTEAGGLTGSAEFSTDLFDEVTIDRLTRHYAALLAAAVQDPACIVDRLPMLSQRERRAILDSCGAVSVFPVVELLHDAFEGQTASTPDAVALRCGDDELTYAALNARANQLARYLRRRGISVDDRVGLCLDRSLDTVVAILGVLKAGGAYVPIDPINPPDRVTLIVEDCGARLVLVNGANSERLPSFSGEIVTLEHARAAIEREAADNLDLPGAPSQLAYIIYTSGSTGRPKGTLIQHDHVQRLFAATDAWFGFGPGDVWTLFHSYGFDFSVWELWGALLYGGRLVIVPYLVSRSPAEFYELVRHEGVTVLNQTPSAFRQLIDAESRIPPSSDLALRLVIFGGEALDIGSLRPWFDRHGDARPRLVNMYGITETTVHVTYRPIRREDLDAGSMIGQPITDLRVVVLDRNLELAPPGVVGELFVGGAGVARGYLGLPELTATRFIPDPFDGGGGRLYRSGDLARLTSNGDLEYRGRIDHQVKVRGFRIELAEIEHALVSNDAVRDALILATDGLVEGERRLVAYVTPRDAHRPSAAALRAHLQARLPDYMVPSAFVVLDHLPLTPHGKIDRGALPSPEEARPESSLPPMLPRTPVERTLADVWGEVLGVRKVSVTDNFFELGGDSILSIKVLARARERGVNVSLQQLFQHQTIAAIAAALPDAEAAAVPDAVTTPFSLLSELDRTAVVARFEDAEDAYPLTHLQNGMLFQAAFNDASTTYHNISSFHLRFAFDAALFGRSVASLMQRHPVLRTSLHTSGFSEPLQVVHSSVAMEMAVDDLRHLPETDQERVIAAWLEAERHRRFEWDIAPLFRFHVHQRGEDTVQITLTEHHAILDGWSVATLLSELMTTCLADIEGAAADPGTDRPSVNQDPIGALSTPLLRPGVASDPAGSGLARRSFGEGGKRKAGSAFELPPPRVRFADQVRLERRALASEAMAQFWREQTRDIVAPPLPQRRQGDRRPGVLVHEADLPPHTVGALDRQAHAAKVPFRTMLLAAHVYLVGWLGNQADVVTGLVVNTRPEEVDGDRALGLFLNTVPLRVAVTDGSWRELVAAVFAAETLLLPHRAYPLAALRRAGGGAPLFNTAFNYVHFHVYDSLARVAGLEVLGQQGFAETDFPLAASFSRDVVTGRVRLSLECAAASLDDAALADIARYYMRALEAMAQDAGGGYQAWSPLSAGERSQLSMWSRGQQQAPQRKLVPERIATHAHTQPGASALAAGETLLSYKGLDERASRMAQSLRRRGVGPNSRVALLADCSPDLIAAMLAVWKAGAAFVPLDPAYPRDRLAFMVADAAPAMVLAAPEHAGFAERATVVPVVSLADFGGDDRDADTASLPGADPDALAYVIYTSGSTGTPKGVMVTHGGLRNLVHGQVPRFGLHAASRVLQYAALGFDAAISEICTTLVAGGTLVLAPRAELRDPERLHQLLIAHEVTTVTLPPTMLAVLSETALPALATMISAGEACRPDLVERWRAGRRLLNAYGPTETTVCATMTGALVGGDSVLPIGGPLENVDVWVLDRFLQPAPCGVVGELFIGGASLARGYNGRPDLTAERFVPHPFSAQPGARLYRTGDAVRWRSDGQLEFVGRLDTQVKVRGVRIELGEIEALLQQHPDVRQAAVVSREEHGTAARLVAYVEPGGRALTIDDLRQHLAARLPEAALPAAIVLLDRLPLTPSGKIDRRALPAPAPERPALAEAFVGPRSDVEATLVAIWAGVLRLDRVGVHDNFFRLGGDSILSLQVVSRARAAGVRITPQQVFAHGTIAVLAAVAGTDAAEATEGPASGDVPLTPIQQWFFALQVPARQHWNQALLLQVPGDVDAGALERAFVAVVAHHQTFRLRFVQVAGGWTQRYAEHGEPPSFEHVDLSKTAAADRIRALEAHASERHASLDLTNGPLIRAVHYRLGTDPGRLLLVVHHLVVDGVSWRILLDDLQLAYLHARQHDAITLPPSSASFQAWARAAAALAGSDRIARHLDYWAAVEREPDPLMDRNVDRQGQVFGPAGDRGGPRPLEAGGPLEPEGLRRVSAQGAANLETDAQTLDLWLDAQNTRDLVHVVPPVYRTETQEVLLAAAAHALTELTGSPRVRLVLEGHGRELPDCEIDVSRTIGWFTASYPVVLDLTSAGTPAASLKAVKEQLRSVPDKGVSYGLTRASAGSAVSTGAISFNYLGQLDAALSDAGASGFAAAAESVGSVRDPHAQRPHLLDIVSSIEGGRLRTTWIYPARLLTRAEVQSVAQSMMTRLSEIIAHCREPEAGGFTPSDFPEMELSSGELDALLAELDGRTEPAS